MMGHGLVVIDVSGHIIADIYWFGNRQHNHRYVETLCGVLATVIRVSPHRLMLEESAAKIPRAVPVTDCRGGPPDRPS